MSTWTIGERLLRRFTAPGLGVYQFTRRGYQQGLLIRLAIAWIRSGTWCRHVYQNQAIVVEIERA